MNVQDRLLLTLAGLFGAVGVVLASVAAHIPDIDVRLLGTVANILLFHAPALIAMPVVAHLGLANGLAVRLSAGMVAFGVALFAIDLCMRVFVYDRLFPNAAPIGGTILIMGWVLFALTALFTARPRRTA